MNSELRTEIMELVVQEIRIASPQVIEIVLVRPDGGRLPGFEAGAHLKMQVPVDGQPVWRHYSLINFDPSSDACTSPMHYLIAVRLEELESGGRGGSHYLHTQLAPMHKVKAVPPVNAFPLQADADDVLLIAGGIGVTPLISMVSTLLARGKRFAMHYSGRELAQLAFLPPLRELAGGALTVYADDAPHDSVARLDIEALLRDSWPRQQLYVCGPRGMVNAVREAARMLGWHDDDVHYELFSEAAVEAGDQAFEVECAQSGCTVQVAADKTILEAMLDAGLDPIYDCKRGDCGVCTVDVLEGEVDHRDNCQTAAERSSGKQIQICISRAKGSRLCLDI